MYARVFQSFEPSPRAKKPQAIRIRKESDHEEKTDLPADERADAVDGIPRFSIRRG